MGIRFILLFLLTTTVLEAQKISKVRNVADKKISPGSILYELPGAPVETKGSYYLDASWHSGNVILSSDVVVKDYPLRFDLKSNGLELKSDGVIRIIGLPLIKSFTWKNDMGDSTRFINTKHFYGSADGQDKIMQVLLSGTTNLYKHTNAYVQKSNYNAALNVGEKHDVIKTRDSFYISSKNKLVQVQSKLKDNKKLLGPIYDKALDFIKTNKLKLNREDDLIQLAYFLNSSNLTP